MNALILHIASIAVFMMSVIPSVAFSADADVPPAYRAVADEYSLPAVLLYSIALTESHDPSTVAFLPWPWTVNDAGKGLFFKNRREAYDYLSQVLKSGRKNFDVGLVQVNWYWNGHVFPSLWDSLDPYANLRAGANILSGHYRRLGSYEEAVGAYHSPGNPDLANAYRERVRGNLATVLRSGAGAVAVDRSRF